MSNRIFRYPLDVKEGRQIVMMRPDAKILSVGVQNEFPVIWALIDALDPRAATPRIIRGVTTGEPFNASMCNFIGTVTLKSWFVYHLFEQFDGTSDVVESYASNDYIEIARELENR